jgi:hypothetical protein
LSLFIQELKAPGLLNPRLLFLNHWLRLRLILYPHAGLTGVLQLGATLSYRIEVIQAHNLITGTTHLETDSSQGIFFLLFLLDLQGSEHSLTTFIWLAAYHRIIWAIAILVAERLLIVVLFLQELLGGAHPTLRVETILIVYRLPEVVLMVRFTDTTASALFQVFVHCILLKGYRPILV